MSVAWEIDGRPIRVTVAGRTDPGRKRGDNQDHFLVADLDAAPGDGGVLLNPDGDAAAGDADFAVGPRGALLLVADGMGGAAAGGLASRMAVAWVYEELASRWRADRNRTPQQFAARLREAVVAANARIHAYAIEHPGCEGMGSTVTAVGVLDDFLYLAQIGDSRAYLVRRGAAVQLTRDQSLVQELVDSGTLSEEEAGRSDRRNLILQALGPQPEVRVDLTYQQARHGDLIVLCSDGLSTLVRRDEIASIAERAPILPLVCDELVELANARGGSDNITVVAARLEGDGLDHPADDDPVGRKVFDVPEA